MVEFFIVLFQAFCLSSILISIFMFIFFRKELKEAYKEWRDDRYGIDFHRKD